MSVLRRQAVGSWSEAACCKASGNRCSNPIGRYPCEDNTSFDDWIFGLGPGGALEKFGPIQHISLQYAWPLSSPSWGNGFRDLNLGGNATLGVGAQCVRHTYAAPTDRICGGGGNWGETNLEVWRLREA